MYLDPDFHERDGILNQGVLCISKEYHFFWDSIILGWGGGGVGKGKMTESSLSKPLLISNLLFVIRNNK